MSKKQKTTTAPKNNKSEDTSDTKISPANEKPLLDIDETPVKSYSGVSPIGVVFLSLLTTIALATGTFAYRDKLASYADKYLNIDFAHLTSEKTTISPPQGFVPVPALNSEPTISAINNNHEKYDERISNIEKQQTDIITITKELKDKIENIKSTPVEAINAEKTITQDIDNSTQIALEEATSKITELETKLAELQNLTTAIANKPATNNNIDIRGLVAFQTLQLKALSGQPFQESLQRVLALVEDTTTIEDAATGLENTAKTGRPNLKTLKDDFQQAITKYMQNNNDAETSIIGKVKNNLSSFVRVRRTDGSGDNNETIISAAENFLANDDVKSSYAELLKLDSKAKEPFLEWLKQARQYYQTPEWLDNIQLELANSLKSGE